MPVQTSRDRTRSTPGGFGFGRPGGRHGIHPVRKPKDTRRALRQLWPYLYRERRQLLGVVLLVTLSTAAGLLGPFLIGRAIDIYIAGRDLAGLARLALYMVSAYIIAAAANWAQAYCMAGIAHRVVADLRDRLFAKLQRLPLRFFDRSSYGDVMSRVTNDIEMISATLSQSVPQLISSTMMVSGTAAVMLSLNFRLALVCLLIVPCLLAVTRLIAARTRQGFREQQQALGLLNGFIEETVSGQPVVKAYCQEENVISQFEAANLRLKEASIKAQILAGLMGPTMNFMNNATLAAVVGVGGWMVLGHLATIGTVTSFVSYMRRFGRPLNQLANLYNAIQSALAGAERVFEIMNEPDEVDSHNASWERIRLRGEVEFRDVSFGYDPETPVLKHVSFRAEPGQTIALVGPTGAGKTTIVNLLTRFYEIDSGEILIDGVDIRQIPKQELRRRLGIVLQDTALFSLSVRENIRYGRPGATDAEVEEAARLAHAHQFITRLPQGYDTVLSGAGGSLSQGQRQLLAIARAILADPSILILDEATSSVDTRTEQYIQAAMLRLMEGRTSFVIAHRLSTIREADVILVIDNGEIVEQGTHRNLLERKGFYYTLYTSQFGQRAQSSGQKPFGLLRR